MHILCTHAYTLYITHTYGDREGYIMYVYIMSYGYMHKMHIFAFSRSVRQLKIWLFV